MTETKTHRCKEGRRINGVANEKQKVTISERRTGSFSNEGRVGPSLKRKLEGHSKLFLFELKWHHSTYST